MQPVTNSLISAARKATKFLQRDFLELEILQTSGQNNENFVNKSYLRVRSILESELQKHSKFLLFPEDHFELKKIIDSNIEIVLLINPIDSLVNLSRSLPFFGLSITYLKRINDELVPIYAVIYFPILNEIYYGEKGKGAWLEKNNTESFNKSMRLRVSNKTNKKSLLIAGDELDQDLNPNKNIRLFGSQCYELALLLSAKLDSLYFSSLNYTLRSAFELIIKEAGGKITMNQEKFYATNYDL